MSRLKPLLARWNNNPLHSILSIVMPGNLATSHGEEKLLNFTGLFLSKSADVACTSRHPWSHSTDLSAVLPQGYNGLKPSPLSLEVVHCLHVKVAQVPTKHRKITKIFILNE